MAVRAERVPPVFVGGAPRSGTHIVAHLVGSHAQYFTIPYELWWHCDRHRGIPAYVEGGIAKTELIESLRTYWWRRPVAWNTELERGMFKLIEREELESAIDEFAAASPGERLGPARALAEALAARIAARFDAPSFAEHTPANLNWALQVLQLFPDARIIHVVRDGRDRACSVRPLPFEVDSFAEAVKRWANILRRGEATAKLAPTGQFHVVQLEDLVAFDRDRSYARLQEFLGLEDDPAMRSFFDAEVTAANAHVGRWRTELADAERDELDGIYREAVADLREDGVTCTPPDRDAELSYSASEGESAVDPWAAGRGGEDL